eukprot:6207294-Pleurochrysis_carterae.AAC.2
MFKCERNWDETSGGAQRGACRPKGTIERISHATVKPASDVGTGHDISKGDFAISVSKDGTSIKSYEYLAAI